MIICTRNRAESLSTTLLSLLSCRGPRSDWEVIVVDNGSSDTTSDVVAEFSGRLPISYVYEGEAGLSNARNAGAREARGEYILWTDDDVIFHPDWIAAYDEAFHAHPDAALFAGRIEANIEEPAPSWLIRGKHHLDGMLVVRDFTEEEALSPDLLPFGASFAVRAAEQRRHPYDPGLGVTQGKRRNGEETAVAKAILAEGGVGFTVPRSVAYHFTPRSRQTLSYLWEYFTAVGIEFSTLERKSQVPVRILKNYILFIVLRLVGREWVGSYKNSAYFYGVMLGRRAASNKRA